MQKDKPLSAPEENRPGEQRDDNIDDLGRKPDGSTLEQPVDAKRSRPAPNAKDKRE